MKQLLQGCALISLTVGIAACAGSSDMRQELATRLAAPAWMVQREIPAAPFSLTAFERIHKRGGDATLYIEGDGLAWVSRKRMSLDPTPNNPVALHLATRDKSENVIYLARPCQYSKMLNTNTPCDWAYWTNKRFAPEVVDSVQTALNEIKARYDIRHFNLVGHSGGGALAAIIAAKRDDVTSLRTVAGNLDHRAHSLYHNVSILGESLNPPDFADKLAQIPQRHFIGGQDKVVPPAILHSYMQALGPTNCAAHTLIQEATHDEGWVDKWPGLLAQKPECTGPARRDYTLEYTPLDNPIEAPVYTPRTDIYSK